MSLPARQTALSSLCLRLVRLAAPSIVVLAVLGLTLDALEFAALGLAHPLEYLHGAADLTSARAQRGIPARSCAARTPVSCSRYLRRR